MTTGGWAGEKPQRKGEAWIQREGDRTAVFNADTGLLHLLNPSALAIWELCDGDTTTEEMAAAIEEVTGLGPDVTVADVEIALDGLSAAGLIDRRPD